MKTSDLHNIRPFPHESRKETWFLADTRQNETIFLKRYWLDLINQYRIGLARREILTYQNIHFPFMLQYYGGDTNEGYSILEYVSDFIDLEVDEKDITELVEIVFGKFHTVNPSFLSTRKFMPFEQSIDLLINEGYPINLDTFKFYAELQSDILKECNFFCHSDLLLQNIKRRPNGKIVIFDFELANINHFLYDLAVLYVDLVDKPKAQEILLICLEKKPNFNKDIFMMLVWKRAVGQVFALRNQKEITRPMETGMEILKKL